MTFDHFQAAAIGAVVAAISGAGTTRGKLKGDTYARLFDALASVRRHVTPGSSLNSRSPAHTTPRGIATKWAITPRIAPTTSWLKIKSPDYCQMADRHELFEARGSVRSGAHRQYRLDPAARPIA